MSGQAAVVQQTIRDDRRIARTFCGIPVGVVHNLFALYGLYCSSYLLALVTVPYLSRVLGPATWGLLAAVQSFGGYLLLTVEFGFALSATREAARFQNDRAALREVLAGVLGAKLALATAGVVVAAAAWRWVPVFHNHTLLLGSGVFWAVVQGSNVMWFFQSLERMRLIVLVDLAAKIGAVGATFAFVRGPLDDWKVLGLQGAASSVSLAISLGLAWREVGFAVPSIRLAADTLRRSLATFIPRNASLLSTVGNAFLLSLFAPPHIVGFYAGADRISRAIVGLLAPASEAVYPRISHLARRSAVEAQRLARLAAVLVGAVAVLMGAAIFLLAPFLVRTLLGPEYEASVPVLRIFSILPPAFALRNVLGIHWMLPLDLERPFNAIMLGAGVLNILLAVLVAPRWGGIGMAWVVAGSQVAASLGTYLLLRWMGMDPLRARTARGRGENPEACLVVDGAVE
jgi:PST family polysaccharide transporter